MVEAIQFEILRGVDWKIFEMPMHFIFFAKFTNYMYRGTLLLSELY